MPLRVELVICAVYSLLFLYTYTQSVKPLVLQLIVMMGNYPSITEYPMVMQRMIAQRAWYESFEAKRVITREGHPATTMYYVLSGSGKH